MTILAVVQVLWWWFWLAVLIGLVFGEMARRMRGEAPEAEGKESPISA